MLILIDNYDSFTANLVHFLGELGAACAGSKIFCICAISRASMARREAREYA